MLAIITMLAISVVLRNGLLRLNVITPSYHLGAYPAAA